jgi:hypothetical protein
MRLSLNGEMRRTHRTGDGRSFFQFKVRTWDGTGGVHLAFNAMTTLSALGPIVIRLRIPPAMQPYKNQMKEL